ncbi:MAG: hypothetical protein Q9227_004694 [Pyrenula ochraceoflavens]
MRLHPRIDLDTRTPNCELLKDPKYHAQKKNPEKPAKDLNLPTPAKGSPPQKGPEKETIPEASKTTAFDPVAAWNDMVEKLTSPTEYLQNPEILADATITLCEPYPPTPSQSSSSNSNTCLWTESCSAMTRIATSEEIKDHCGDWMWEHWVEGCIRALKPGCHAGGGRKDCVV